jgi:AAA domain (dynein-related subfamily)
MLQKDILGQDMFLLGRPGPLRRSIALQYLQLTQREIEYVALSRDTTESDLKQRREILNGTAIYFDQSVVRAAKKGRILVIEGVEKAERNVLPVLNNLLENREMHLEDGHFLIPADRYDKLLKEHTQEELNRWGLVRVSEDFRVIALGLPVPKYRGAPLDPPLRSRFQARDVTSLSYQVRF